MIGEPVEFEQGEIAIPHRKGVDEQVALMFATQAARLATDEEVELDRIDSEAMDDNQAPYRISRIGHGLIRDKGSSHGIDSLADSIAMQGAVRRIVRHPQFVAAARSIGDLKESNE